MRTKTLGVLGGLGPLSGVYFCEMLIRHTRADRDQDHLNFLLSSRAETPDRTDFILGRSHDNPLPIMVEEAKKLTAAGADLLCMPCNTAHYFYDGICREISIPMINIIEETASFCSFLGLRRVGLLATEGTVRSRADETYLEPCGITCVTCTEEEQAVISHTIYGEIKQGKAPSLDRFLQVADRLTARGCDALILGCTELSLLKRNHLNDSRFIDSMEVLACVAIHRCGKCSTGFDDRLTRFGQTDSK